MVPTRGHPGAGMNRRSRWETSRRMRQQRPARAVDHQAARAPPSSLYTIQTSLVRTVVHRRERPARTALGRLPLGGMGRPASDRAELSTPRLPQGTGIPAVNMDSLDAVNSLGSTLPFAPKGPLLRWQ